MMIKNVYLIIFFLSAPLFAKTDKKCPPGQYLVQGHYRSAYTTADGKNVSATSVKPYCKLLTRAYGYVVNRYKDGTPPKWPHKSEKSKLWTDLEKQKIIELLEQIPEALLSARIVGFYRLQKSKDYPNPATSAPGIIAIYDSFFDRSREQGRILVHELSHQNYEDLKESERQDYRRATNWRLELGADQKFYWTGRKNGYVSEDGKNSHEEDYANNIEYFLYIPDKLKEVTPNAYQWIKNRFGETFKSRSEKK